MAEKLHPDMCISRDNRESISSLDSDKSVHPEVGDESSDSDGEQEGPQKLIRKVSTSGQIRSKKSINEGLLLKQTSSFQRWKKRYFKLRGRTLYWAKDSKSLIFDEVDLSNASVAETSTKNINNSFTASQLNMEHFSGMHNWYTTSHARPTFCNVCREALPGMTSHGLSCEVCKFKAHKRCAVRAINNCKWTTLASVGNDIIEDEEGVAMPHQWLEGNLPVSARCAVCDKACGSVRRLQDWRCLWCKAIVHNGCKELLNRKCPLGQCKLSVIPPTALNSIDSDGFWKATYASSCTSPLLVLVNSKSGDNQGVKFLRKFKQLLNPAQVFDLMIGGPHLGLRLFQKFATFRILACGGDGSVGWVLSEIDKLGLHKQCKLGVLPLGTGNDLARVLGWGGLCDDDAQLPQVVAKLERATTKMLDRWSIMTYEAATKPPPIVTEDELYSQVQDPISQYADSVVYHLTKVLDSDQHSDVISSAKFLCGTVSEFIAEVGKAYKKAEENQEEADAMASKCAMLTQKLDSLVKALSDEAQAVIVPAGISPSAIADQSEKQCTENGGHQEKLPEANAVPKIFKSKEQLMLRANSLKKALRQIIEQTEKVVDEQNRQSQVIRSSSSNYLLATSLEGESSEELRQKDAETGGVRRGTLTSMTATIFLDQSDGTSALSFTEEPSSLSFSEKCVMNNYFGIGLDAKISLEFNNKRDEHPKKCRSRTKNMMWYGVLGTKELLQRTYKNLEQRVHLECDGVSISLPSLQGLAVLNIPSYAGGINFWGGTKENDNYGAPSFDDKKLEVVAVFGSIQMAVSRVINLQYHRIAQCRTVKITISGDEGVPVQVDGEAWIQPPGIIKIQHKNRAQMLTRDRAFESTLKSWEDKRKGDSLRQMTRPRLSSQQSMEFLTEEEMSEMQQFVQSAETLINRATQLHNLRFFHWIDFTRNYSIRDILRQWQFRTIYFNRDIRIHRAAERHKVVEQELAHAVNGCSHVISEVLPKQNAPDAMTRNAVVDIFSSVKALCTETKALLDDKLLELESSYEEELQTALSDVESELQKLAEIHWLGHIIQTTDVEEHSKGSNKSSIKIRIKNMSRKEKLQKQKSNSSLLVERWGTDEVAVWLESLKLGEYKDIFARHDIQGSELLQLERRNLKDLGITKVGHMKRILHGIKDIDQNTVTSEL
ncbi:diacylglycerol kinase eta isoform X2 [Carcharodon carcharias]|uniref:diacylglycerol kinase eta isoform X2 n=1 Tax=Carcharodon carcharias TaxID=13397 RepID=UPI001B7F6220|nr:diacylglycerol kinase eta isoform X2 [Carcharodon carcharias]